MAMGYVSIGMGDHFTALLLSLMALRLKPVERNPFDLVLTYFSQIFGTIYTQKVTAQKNMQTRKVCRSVIKCKPNK